MKEIAGHSSNYVTIASALRFALVDYLELYASLGPGRRAQPDGATGLAARRITVVVLSAALCEACINTFLALSLDEDAFLIIDKASTTEKWTTAPKLVSPFYSFPSGSALNEDLGFVFRCRNSIMHHKVDVFTDKARTHKGTFWAGLDHSSVKRIASLPIRLIELLRPIGGFPIALMHQMVSAEIAACNIGKSA